MDWMYLDLAPVYFCEDGIRMDSIDSIVLDSEFAPVSIQSDSQFSWKPPEWAQDVLPRRSKNAAVRVLGGWMIYFMII
jgi:hypothetical protein